MALPIVPVREGYDRWAPHYDDYDNAVISLEQPRVRELIGEVAGRRVVDVGCGTGRHALRMAAEGAEVTGVDFSSGMLEILRAKLAAAEGAEGKKLGLEIVEHDLREGLPLEDRSYELALCCLVLEHLPRLELMLAEIARVCRPGARVILADFHPEMFRRGLHARFRAGEGAQKVQIEGIDHTISDYVMAALRAGLEIVDMAELCMDTDTAARSASASKYLGEPMLLTMVCRAPR